MNNNPIGWPDNGFNYDSSTQTLNVPRRLAINAPASYTGNLLDFTASGATRLRFSRKVSTSLNTCYGFYIPAVFPDAYGEDGYFFGDTASTKHGMSTRYSSSSYGICFWGLGVAYAAIANDGFYVNTQLGFVGGSTLGGNPDTFLVRDGAHTLAMQRTTNAQTLRVYNTYTSATNYERGKLEWSGNVFNVGTEKGSGGGTARSMALQTDGVTRVTLDATTTKLTLSDPATSQDYRLTAASYWLTLGQGNGTDKAFGFISNTNSNVQFQVVSGGFIGWVSSSIDATGTADLILRRDAANTLAQYNGTNAQTYRVYNTYTSSTNYERGKLEWSSNVFRIGTEKGSGGGTARAVEVQTDSITRLALDTTGSVRVVTGLTVATLPASPTVGMIARVTDASAPTIGSTVAGGGAANALCWYNGTNWTVMGI